MVIENYTTPKRLLEEGGVNFCYSDESGMAQEPIATMVGIIVDAGRMRLTKKDWQELLATLSDITHRTIIELKTSEFYPGNGVWRNLDGVQRANVIESIFDWLIQRKHSVVYSSIVKNSFNVGKGTQIIPIEINSVWQFLGFHITLAIQKYSQPEQVPKGYTLLTFDNRSQDESQFIELIKNPPAWSEDYYAKKTKQSALDQIIDVPHFSDSKDIGLLQVADFLAFFLRRYAEIKEGLSIPAYTDEETRLDGWMTKFRQLIIPSSNIYMKSRRKPAHDLFYQYAAPSLRSL
ncbi:MAG: DUF3800 domain-containing protein [Dehalococcoidia bacterium]|nr:DUF3800 domain-containing protein [Dehalococcoidia bacterium]